MSAKLASSLLVIFLALPLTLYALPFVQAQDEGGDQTGGGSQSPSEMSGVETGVTNDAPAADTTEAGATSGAPSISEQSRDNWATDPNFNDPGISEASRNAMAEIEALRNEAPTADLGTLDDVDFKTVEREGIPPPSESTLKELAVAAAREVEETGNTDGQAVAVYNQAMQTFMQANAPAAALEVSINNHMLNDLPGTTINEMIAAINVNPNLSNAQIAVAVGHAFPAGSGYGEEFFGPNFPDHAVAGYVTVNLVSRNESAQVGDIMSSVAIANQTSLGAGGTAEQITQSAIISTSIYSEPDTKDFAAAAFALGNTYGVSPETIQAQLAGRGVSENNIISGAQSQGISLQK